MKEDRIPCLTPGCRRTAPADKYEPGTQIVCGKCWRKLPKRLTNRYKQLRKRQKRMDRLVRKAPAARAHGKAVWRMSLRFDAQWDRMWAEIVASLQKPDKPEGLEAFLEEMGMTDR